MPANDAIGYRIICDVACWADVAQITSGGPNPSGDPPASRANPSRNNIADRHRRAARRRRLTVVRPRRRVAAGNTCKLGEPDNMCTRVRNSAYCNRNLYPSLPHALGWCRMSARATRLTPQSRVYAFPISSAQPGVDAITRLTTDRDECVAYPLPAGRLTRCPGPCSNYLSNCHYEQPPAKRSSSAR